MTCSTPSIKLRFLLHLNELEKRERIVQARKQFTPVTIEEQGGSCKSLSAEDTLQ